MVERIFLSSPHMSEEGYEQKFVKEAFDTNWIAPLGENVNKFEEEISEIVGCKDAAALSAGTAAIHLALKAVGVEKGDIVFCPSLTFSATANPIIYQDATPVFIDSEEDTWNMSPVALKKAFEKYPNVKAVIVVHLYGLAAKMEEIVTICKAYNVSIIEDAAESLGTTIKGKHTGTFGDYGIFSFNGNKIITTSGGGMVVSNREDAKEKIAKIRFWATQSREQERHYEHKEIGYNYRMSNVAAGIGRGQLRVLQQRVEQKQHIYNYYKKELGGLEGLTFMPIHEWENSNCWLTCVQLSGKIKPIDILLALEAENIEARPIWKPMHMQPIFKMYDYIDNGGVAEQLFVNGVCLPSDTKMVDDELERVCKIIKSLWV